MKSIKEKVTDWVLDRIHDTRLDSEKLSLKNHFFYFKIEGFCDEPEIFLVATTFGLEWGYNTFIWDGPSIPLPTKKLTRKLPWGTLKSMNREQKKEKIINEMVKAVTSKKREYRRCQYCNKKMHLNGFYDNKTCSACAEKHLGIYIVY
ncbi:hypothetical protein [Neobacillus mesonae]|uniref:hypothetical protein n=1 Tax=Neobacillus mesonae TaxID=1193713 RepID=UPI002E239670|nr:hypothetical protein [Neobacillus mesonae]